MKIEVIAIGDEILLGQIENTNSSWIAKLLSHDGFKIHRMSVIPDDEQAITRAFQKAFMRSDITLITGGLGPTHDDLTKDLIAKFFDLPMAYRSDLMKEVRDAYDRKQLSFVETSREQAEFPEGATSLHNEHGTAPGIWVEREGRIFVAMPGVPVEMKGIMVNSVLPRLQKMRHGSVILYRTMHTFGVIESQLFELLDNRAEILERAKLSFLPGYSGLRMRLTAEGKSHQEAEERLEEAEKMLYSKVGDYIFGQGEDYSLEAGVGELLKRNRMKLTVAESCTGGLLSKRMTDTPGSTSWFDRGFVTYTNESKHELLGVSYKLLNAYGAVSPEVAESMAEGALRSSRAQVAVSLTGIAGPGGGTPEKPVGLTYIGYADSKTTLHKRILSDGDRDVNRTRSSTAALTLLVKQINNIENP